jgi:hypothetical protein
MFVLSGNSPGASISGQAKGVLIASLSPSLLVIGKKLATFKLQCSLGDLASSAIRYSH